MLTLRPVRLSFSSPGQGTWAESIEGRYSYRGEPGEARFNAWARCCSPDGGWGVRWLTEEAYHDSEAASPPLWKNSPASAHDMNRAIAQFQKEMLDKVREAPESDFELSLKDLVELSPEQEIQTPAKEKELPIAKVGSRKEQDKSTKEGRRAESMNHGVFLLKMFLPLPGSRRRSSGCRSVGSEEQKGRVLKSGGSEVWSREDSSSSLRHKRRGSGGCNSFFFWKC